MTKDRLAALKAVSIRNHVFFVVHSSCRLKLMPRSATLIYSSFAFLPIQAQSEDDDTGPDDVAVTVEAQDGYMEAFFAEVTTLPLTVPCLFNPITSFSSWP
jgi:hypothetical protein